MGSFSDPDVVPGLAHFLEHSKYPAAIKVASKFLEREREKGRGLGTELTIQERLGRGQKKVSTAVCSKIHVPCLVYSFSYQMFRT